MKKRMLFFLAVLFTVSCVSVYASQGIQVFVDGRQIEFDVEPQMIGGRTMVPLRAIFEALGASVEWDEASQSITAYNEAYFVQCTVGSNEMFVNNEKRITDVPPLIVDDRTLVPARFVAEAFGCEVNWDAESFTVTITSNPIDYGSLEQETSDPAPEPSPTPSSQPGQGSDQMEKGSRGNPYSALDGAAIQYQEWSFEPVRTIAVTCTDVIRGVGANILADSENMFNEKPKSNEEWCFLEFNIQYISSEGGADDVLEGPDIIYEDTFFDASGSAIAVRDMATLGDVYGGYGVFDTEIYPGGTRRVVIGILIDKDVEDIVLRVPNDSLGTNTWILCNR